MDERAEVIKEAKERKTLQHMETRAEVQGILSDGIDKIDSFDGACTDIAINAQTAFISGNDTICDNGQAATIQIHFTGNAPFTFIYALDVVIQPSITTTINPHVIYTSVAGAVTALYGPRHGGANEAVVKMFGEIGNKNNIPKYIAKAKDKNDRFRLMGFGHRVYKNFDPRATIIREECHKVLNAMENDDDPMFELAQELEQIALKDEYFIERNLYPNVDFYSGIIYQAMGIPKEMFTVMFALARTVGWATHWCEMQSQPNLKIGRPRQLYLGEQRRDYIAIDQR